MFAVTYQAEELNLLPAIANSQTQFNGELHLDARPDGSWTIEGISILTTDYMARPIVMASVDLPAYHPLYALVVAAAEAYDRETSAIRDHVTEKLIGAYSAAARDHTRAARAA